MNSELRGKVGILALREQLRIIFLFSHTMWSLHYSEILQIPSYLDVVYNRLCQGFTEVSMNAIADSLYVRRRTMVNIPLIMQKLHLLGLHSLADGYNSVIPGAKRLLCYLWFHWEGFLKLTDLMCMSAFPALISAHQKKAPEPIGQHLQKTVGHYVGAGNVTADLLVLLTTGSRLHTPH